MISYGFGESNLNSLKEHIKYLEIEDSIIWIGNLEYDDMPAYYNASDLVISIPNSDSSPKQYMRQCFVKRL